MISRDEVDVAGDELGVVEDMFEEDEIPDMSELGTADEEITKPDGI